MSTLDTRADPVPAPPPADDSTVLRLGGVTKRFANGVTALDDVSMEARRGQVVGLLGHNGAGKTTIVRLIAGLLGADSGRVSVLGMDPVGSGLQVRRRIGVLPNTPLVDTRLTARENLEFAGRLLGLGGRGLDTRVRSLLEEFGVLARADDRVSTFSAGMRQRTALARVMLSGPEVLLMDEPSTALDPVAIRELHELIQTRSREQGITTVLCTHDLGEAAKLCDQVLILSEGRVIASGAPQELAERADAAVAVDVECDPRDTEAAVSVMTRLGSADRVGRGAFRIDGVPRSAIPGLVTELARAGVRVYMVRGAQATLEDLYLRLHGKSSEPNGGNR